MAVSVKKEIDIAASVPEVMEVLADVESLPKWSTAHTSAEILDKDEEGWPLKVREVISQFGVKDTMTLDYEWYEEELSWTLAEESSAQKAQECHYQLTDNGDGTTHVEFDLTVELKLKLPGLVVKQGQKLAADTATKGLKKEVERRYA